MRLKNLLNFGVVIVQLSFFDLALHAQFLNVDFGAGTNSAKAGFAATGQRTNDYWNLYTRDDGNGGYRTFGTMSNLKWADGTGSAVSLSVSNAPGAWNNGATDPMYDSYLYPLEAGNIAVTVTGLPAGSYDLYLYGHGAANNQNSVFGVGAGSQDYGTKATTTTSGWTSAVWQEGQQYVVFRGVTVASVGQELRVTALPGASGYAIINGIQIVQTATVPPPVAGPLLDVDFGVGTTSAKAGFAATGQTTNDHWNLYTRDDGNGGYRTFGTMSNLKWADGTGSAVSLSVSNAPGAWNNGATDPMYDSYLYPLDVGNIAVTVTGLPAGSYDLYLYGHGAANNQNSVFGVGAGSQDYGTKATTTTSGWTSAVWQEGQQYVVFRGVTVASVGQELRVTALPGASGYAIINGIQIVQTATVPPPVAGPLLDVDFGVGTTSAKGGFAATGQSTNDYWNLYSRDDGSGGYRTVGTVSNLKWADGTVSAVGLTVTNAPGAWQNGTADPMFNVYLYPLSGGNITVTVTNLPLGTYDLFIYGHGGPGVDTANGVFQVVSGSSEYGTKATTTTSGWSSPVWQEGQQYVVFRDVAVVNARGSVTVTVFPGAYGLAFISGMQAVQKSPTSPPVTAFTNGSFELPALAPGASVNPPAGSTTAITGWTVGSTGVVSFANGPALGVSPVDGVQQIGFNGGNTPPGGSVSQSFSTAVGQTYKVSFYVGRIGPGSGTMSLHAVVKSAASELLGSFTGTAPGSPGYGSAQTFTFTAATETSTLMLVDTSTATVAVDLLLDNVSVVLISPPVPDFTNGSFELPALAVGASPTLPPGSTLLMGWTVGSNGVVSVVNGIDFGVNPVDGVQHVVFNAGNGPAGGSVFQTFSTTVGQTYAVSFYVGRAAPGAGTMRLLAEVTSSAGAALGSLAAMAPGSSGYGSAQTFTFTATTTNSKLTFTDTSLATVGVDVLVDKVSVTPSSGPCVASLSGLVNWWQGEGDAKDSVDGANGTLQNGATFGAGKVGQAFSFDGGDDYVSFGNTAGNFGTNDFTIDFWIRTTATRHESLMGKRPTCSDAGSLFVIQIGSTPPWSGPGRLEAAMTFDNAGTDLNAISAGRPINDGVFHHVAFVRQGTNVVFYIDGVPDVATNVLSGSINRINNTTDLTIGRNACTGVDGLNPFTGQMDEISTYNRALTSDEIQAIYNAGSAGKCAPPLLPARALAHWKFDETVGTTARDSAGLYNGTLSATGANFVPAGVSGGALSLSKASNGFVSMGNVLGLDGTDFSIIAWIKMAAGDSTDSSMILSKNAAYTRNGYALNVNKTGGLLSDNKASFIEGGSGVAQITTAETPISTTSVNDGNWHQIVIVYQLGGMKSIYVDGAPAEDSKLSQPFNQNSVAFLIGGLNYSEVPTGLFTGLIDEVQIYNYSLADADLNFLFQNPGQEIAPHNLPPGDWRLNAIAGIGGTITRNPDLAKYTNGSTVTVTAVANAGFAFSGWSGDADGTNNSITITMAGNKTVTASFRDAAPPTVTITSPVSGSTSDERFQLAGSVADNGGVISARWDWNGQAMGSLALTNNQFLVGSLKLTLGDNRVAVFAVDAAGNQGVAEVVATWAPARILSVVSPDPRQEGQLVDVPVRLISQGDVGGMSFTLEYDTNYLRDPQLTWSSQFGSALDQVNYDTPGLVRATFALPATAVPAGTQAVAAVSFRARSVPTNLTTALTLKLVDVSLPTGNSIAFGNLAESGSAAILLRRVIGDNNANDRFDVGDASIMQRLLIGLETVRSWDVRGNDVNANSSLDSGDVIRVLRAVVGLDPQPQFQSASRPSQLSKSGLGKAGPSPSDAVFGLALLSPDGLRGQPGELVTVQVHLQEMAAQLEGASFTLDYPTNALRLVNAQSARTGALVPSSALTLWNVQPAQNDYAAQNGRVRVAISSATPWPTSNGVLAEFVFQVQTGQTAQYRWPIWMSNAEVSAGGYDVQLLADAETFFIGRNPIPPNLSSTSSGWSSNGFSLSLTGELGVAYRIEVSSDLLNWLPLTTLTTSSDGSLSFVDEAATRSTQRFYRAKQQ